MKFIKISTSPSLPQKSLVSLSGFSKTTMLLTLDRCLIVNRIQLTSPPQSSLLEAKLYLIQTTSDMSVQSVGDRHYTTEEDSFFPKISFGHLRPLQEYLDLNQIKFF